MGKKERRKSQEMQDVLGSSTKVSDKKNEKLVAVIKRVFGLDGNQQGSAALSPEVIQENIELITPVEAYEALMPLVGPGLERARTCSFFSGRLKYIKDKANLLCSQLSDIEVKEKICSSLAQKITMSAVAHFINLPQTANNASTDESVSVDASQGAGARTSEDSAADDSADSDTDASADSDTGTPPAAVAATGAQAGGGPSVPCGTTQAKAKNLVAKTPTVVDPIDAYLLGSKAIEAEQAAIFELAEVEQALRLPITEVSGLKVPITRLHTIAESCQTLVLHRGFEEHKEEISKLLKEKEKAISEARKQDDALFMTQKIEVEYVEKIDCYIKQSVEQQLRQRPEMVVDLQKRHLFVFVNTLLLRLYILVEEINTLSEYGIITSVKNDGDSLPTFVSTISLFAKNIETDVSIGSLSKALELLKLRFDAPKLDKLFRASNPLVEHDKSAFGSDFTGSNSIDNAVLNKVFLFMQHMLRLVVETKKISDELNPSPWVEIHNFNNLMSSYAEKRNEQLAAGQQSAAGQEAKADEQLKAWDGNLFVSSMETVTANLVPLSSNAPGTDFDGIFLNALKIIINYMSSKLNGPLSDGGDSPRESDQLYSIFCSQLLPEDEELDGVKCADCGLQELKDMFVKFFTVIRELNKDSYDADHDNESIGALADIKASLKKCKINYSGATSKAKPLPSYINVNEALDKNVRVILNSSIVNKSRAICAIIAEEIYKYIINYTAFKGKVLSVSVADQIFGVMIANKLKIIIKTINGIINENDDAGKIFNDEEFKGGGNLVKQLQGKIVHAFELIIGTFASMNLNLVEVDETLREQCIEKIIEKVKAVSPNNLSEVGGLSEDSMRPATDLLSNISAEKSKQEALGDPFHMTDLCGILNEYKNSCLKLMQVSEEGKVIAIMLESMCDIYDYDKSEEENLKNLEVNFKDALSAQGIKTFGSIFPAPGNAAGAGASLGAAVAVGDEAGAGAEKATGDLTAIDKMLLKTWALFKMQLNSANDLEEKQKSSVAVGSAVVLPAAILERLSPSKLAVLLAVFNADETNLFVSQTEVTGVAVVASKTVAECINADGLNDSIKGYFTLVNLSQNTLRDVLEQVYLSYAYPLTSRCIGTSSSLKSTVDSCTEVFCISLKKGLHECFYDMDLRQVLPAFLDVFLKKSFYQQAFIASSSSSAATSITVALVEKIKEVYEYDDAKKREFILENTEGFKKIFPEKIQGLTGFGMLIDLFFQKKMGLSNEEILEAEETFSLHQLQFGVKHSSSVMSSHLKRKPTFSPEEQQIIAAVSNMLEDKDLSFGRFAASFSEGPANCGLPISLWMVLPIASDIKEEILKRIKFLSSFNSNDASQQTDKVSLQEIVLSIKAIDGIDEAYINKLTSLQVFESNKLHDAQSKDVTDAIVQSIRNAIGFIEGSGRKDIYNSFSHQFEEDPFNCKLPEFFWKFVEFDISTIKGDGLRTPSPVDSSCGDNAAAAAAAAAAPAAADAPASADAPAADQPTTAHLEDVISAITEKLVDHTFYFRSSSLQDWQIKVMEAIKAVKIEGNLNSDVLDAGHLSIYNTVKASAVENAGKYYFVIYNDDSVVDMTKSGVYPSAMRIDDLLFLQPNIFKQLLCYPSTLSEVLSSADQFKVSAVNQEKKPAAQVVDKPFDNKALAVFKSIKEDRTCISAGGCEIDNKARFINLGVLRIAEFYNANKSSRSAEYTDLKSFSEALDLEIKKLPVADSTVLQQLLKFFTNFARVDNNSGLVSVEGPETMTPMSLHDVSFKFTTQQKVELLPVIKKVIMRGEIYFCYNFLSCLKNQKLDFKLPKHVWEEVKLVCQNSLDKTEIVRKLTNGLLQQKLTTGLGDAIKGALVVVGDGASAWAGAENFKLVQFREIYALFEKLINGSLIHREDVSAITGVIDASKQALVGQVIEKLPMFMIYFIQTVFGGEEQIFSSVKLMKMQDNLFIISNLCVKVISLFEQQSPSNADTSTANTVAIPNIKSCFNLVIAAAKARGNLMPFSEQVDKAWNFYEKNLLEVFLRKDLSRGGECDVFQKIKSHEKNAEGIINDFINLLKSLPGSFTDEQRAIMPVEAAICVWRYIKKLQINSARSAVLFGQGEDLNFPASAAAAAAPAVPAVSAAPAAAATLTTDVALVQESSMADLFAGQMFNVLKEIAIQGPVEEQARESASATTPLEKFKDALLSMIECIKSRCASDAADANPYQLIRVINSKLFIKLNSDSAIDKNFLLNFQQTIASLDQFPCPGGWVGINKELLQVEFKSCNIFGVNKYLQGGGKFPISSCARASILDILWRLSVMFVPVGEFNKKVVTLINEVGEHVRNINKGEAKRIVEGVIAVAVLNLALLEIKKADGGIEAYEGKDNPKKASLIASAVLNYFNQLVGDSRDGAAVNQGISSRLDLTSVGIGGNLSWGKYFAEWIGKKEVGESYDSGVVAAVVNELQRSVLIRGKYYLAGDAVSEELATDEGFALFRLDEAIEFKLQDCSQPKDSCTRDSDGSDSGDSDAADRPKYIDGKKSYSSKKFIGDNFKKLQDVPATEQEVLDHIVATMISVLFEYCDYRGKVSRQESEYKQKDVGSIAKFISDVAGQYSVNERCKQNAITKAVIAEAVLCRLTWYKEKIDQINLSSVRKDVQARDGCELVVGENELLKTLGYEMPLTRAEKAKAVIGASAAAVGAAVGSAVDGVVGSVRKRSTPPRSPASSGRSSRSNSDSSNQSPKPESDSGFKQFIDGGSKKFKFVNCVDVPAEELPKVFNKKTIIEWLSNNKQRYLLPTDAVGITNDRESFENAWFGDLESTFSENLTLGDLRKNIKELLEGKDEKLMARILVSAIISPVFAYFDGVKQKSGGFQEKVLDDGDVAAISEFIIGEIKCYIPEGGKENKDQQQLIMDAVAVCLANFSKEIKVDESRMQEIVSSVQQFLQDDGRWENIAQEVGIVKIERPSALDQVKSKITRLRTNSNEGRAANPAGVFSQGGGWTGAGGGRVARSASAPGASLKEPRRCSDFTSNINGHDEDPSNVLSEAIAQTILSAPAPAPAPSVDNSDDFYHKHDGKKDDSYENFRERQSYPGSSPR